MRRIVSLLMIHTIAFSLLAQKPELIVPSFHTAPLESLRLSPDGTYLITGGGDQVLKVWNYAKGKEIKNFPTSDDIEEAIFSPDGKLVAATDKKHLYLIELASMQLQQKIKFPYRALVYGIAFSADSRSIYYGYNPDGKKTMEVHQMDLNGNNDRLIFSEAVASAYENIGALSTSPDGHYLHIYNYKKGNYLVNLRNPQDIKTSPSAERFFLPNGHLLTLDKTSGKKLIATDPASGAVKWSKQVGTISSSSKYSTKEHFFIDPVGEKLSFSVANGDNNLLLVIDYKTGQATEQRQVKAKHRLIQLAEIQGNRLQLTEQPKLLTIVDPSTNTVLKEFGQPLLLPSFIAGHAAVKRFAVSGFYNHEIKQVNFDKGRVNVWSLPTKKGNNKLAFSADGSTAAGADIYNYDGVIEVFKEGKKLRDVPQMGYDKKLLDIALSADGSMLAIVHFELLKVVDTKSGAVLFSENMANEFYKYSGGKLTFDTNDKLLLEFDANIEKGSSSDRKTLRCYSTQSKRLLWAKQANYQYYHFKDDNTILAADASKDKSIQLNASTGAILSNKPLAQLNFSGWDASYNLYHQQLAVADEANINLFNLQLGRLDGQLIGATANIRDLTCYQQDFLFSVGDDNVVRLWGTKNKVELAKLILYNGSKEWALVTPGGYFDGSQAAISQMYYTRGQEFIPLEQLYEQFYTPNLLEQLLEREVEPAPVEIEDILPPPEVRIEYKAGQRNLVVEDDTPAQQIEVNKEAAIIEVIASASRGSIEELRLFHNGKIIESGSRGLVVDDDVPGEKHKQFQIKLLPGENSFRAIAVNNQRTESAPAHLLINFAPPKTTSDPVTTSAGLNLHLVVVGINEYKNRKYNLNYALADAEAFKNAVSQGMRGITSNVKTHFVKNNEADKQGILKALQTVKEQSNPQDILIFYYAGHGVMSEGFGDHKKDFYLVPHDVTQLYGADDALAQKGISATEMKALTAGITAQKQLFILDACQSAGAVETIAMRGAAEEKAIAQLARSTGTHWLTASGSEQFATEFAQLGHGVFTYALLEGLKGRADSGDKKVTVNELKAWLESEVPELTQQYKGTPQYPASYGYGQDFPVGLVK